MCLGPGFDPVGPAVVKQVPTPGAKRKPVTSVTMEPFPVKPPLPPQGAAWLLGHFWEMSVSSEPSAVPGKGPALPHGLYAHPNGRTPRWKRRTGRWEHSWGKWALSHSWCPSRLHIGKAVGWAWGTCKLCPYLARLSPNDNIA